METCGSQFWWFSNDTLRPYVKGTCQDGHPFSFFNLAACICPLPAEIDPCKCGLSSISLMAPVVTATLNCANQNLNDSAMAAVVYKTPSWSPIDTVILKGNQLTRLPAHLSKYTQLVNLNFASNGITSIDAGNESLALLSAAVQFIDLSSNLITQIKPGAFPPNLAPGARIQLNVNPMGELSEEVYGPDVNYFNSKGYDSSNTFIDFTLTGNLMMR